MDFFVGLGIGLVAGSFIGFVLAAWLSANDPDNQDFDF